MAHLSIKESSVIHDRPWKCREGREDKGVGAGEESQERSSLPYCHAQWAGLAEPSLLNTPFPPVSSGSPRACIGGMASTMIPGLVYGS